MVFGGALFDVAPVGRTTEVYSAVFLEHRLMAQHVRLAQAAFRFAFGDFGEVRN